MCITFKNVSQMHAAYWNILQFEITIGHKMIGYVFFLIYNLMHK